MSQRTIKVTNALSVSKKAIIAKAPSITDPIEIAENESQDITFTDTETLTLSIKNGAGVVFHPFPGYVELPAWAEFDFSGDHDCPGGQTPQITVTGSAVETKIAIKEGKADFFTLKIHPKSEGVKPGEENVRVGDDQT